MVLSFIGGESGHGDFEHLVAGSISMLGDAHRSFELATGALLLDGDTDSDQGERAASAIRDIDRRINRAEQELRNDLVDHISRRGSSGIHTVLGFTVLIKKIERCGDQAKNILELTEGGVSLADVPETPMLLDERTIVSELFARTAQLLTDTAPEPEVVDDFAERVDGVSADCQARIDSYLTCDRPGHEVVPLAIYSGFQLRIAANLMGVVWAWAEPEYLTGGDDELM